MDSTSRQYCRSQYVLSVIISTANRKALLKVIGRESDRKIALDTINMLVTVCQQGIKREKARAKSQFGEAAGVELAYASGFIKQA